jgi:hypothetical protein
VNAVDDEEDREYRQLEVKYDKLYQQIYEQRRNIVLGNSKGEELLAEYEARAKELDDDSYKTLEVDPIDVKDIQNTPTGVYGFWLRAMLFHPLLAKLITEKDRPILLHLQEVTCTLHD